MTEGAKNGQTTEHEGDEYELMSMAEIINGQLTPGGFEGLLPIVQRYVKSLAAQPTEQERAQLERYWSLIARRASGELLNTATWMRGFIRAHPAYKHDSVVPEPVAHDLLQAAHNVSAGKLVPPELLGLAK